MKRLACLLLFLGIGFIISAKSSFAQSTAISPTATSSAIPYRINSDVPVNSGTNTQIVLLEVMAAISCQLTGIDPIDANAQCLGADPRTGKIGFVEGGGGAIGLVTQGIAMTFNIPVSSGEYARYTASNFGITKSTYAQELSHGYKSIRPLMNIWIQFRNAIYVLFVGIFMLIGVAIIFRFKIDPRTVMSIQNAVPKALVVILLVTFSFAIVGFLIDLMYIFMYLFYEIIAGVKDASGTPISLTGLNPTNLQGTTPFGAAGSLGGINGIATGASSGMGTIISAVFEGTIGSVLGTAIWTILGAGIGSVIPIGGTLVGGIVGAGIGLLGGSVFGHNMGNELIGFLGGFIAYFIIIIALLFALFRLWFLLIKAYLFILIDTVTAPIWIAGSLIPGSPLSAGSWFKHIFSYIAVFPVTLFMFLLGQVFIQAFTNASGSSYFTPPFIGNSINPGNFGAIIGLAILLMTPEVVNIVKDALHAPSVKYQAAIGTAFGMGANVINKSVSPVKSNAVKFGHNGEAEGWLNKPIATKLQRRAYLNGKSHASHVKEEDEDVRREQLAPGAMGKLTRFALRRMHDSAKNPRNPTYRQPGH